MDILKNSEALDERSHSAASHLGLHCLLSLNQSSGAEVHYSNSVLSGHSKIDRTKILMTNGSLMKVLEHSAIL